MSLSGNEEGAATPVEGPWLGGNIRSADRQGRGEARALHIGDVGPYREGLGRGGGGVRGGEGGGGISEGKRKHEDAVVEWYMGHMHGDGTIG